MIIDTEKNHQSKYERAIDQEKKKYERAKQAVKI